MLDKAYRVAVVHLSKNLKRPRTIIALILLLIVTDFFLRGIRDFCAATDSTVSFWGVVALMLSAPNSACLIVMLFAFITSDLPGRDQSEPYIFVRSGAYGWISGKIIAAIIYSVLYIIIVNICCLIVLNRYCGFGFEWGKILYTLTRTNAVELYGVRLYISAKVIGNYSSVQAYLYSAGLNIMLLGMLGVWILTINALTGKTAGNILVIALAYLNQALGGMDLSFLFMKFSPVSWASLEMINDGTFAFRPTLAFSLSAMATGTLTAVILLYVTRKKIHIEDI